MKSLTDIFNDQQVENILSGRKDGYKIYHEWLELFAKELREPNGKFKTGKFIWEAYWARVLPSVNGNKAITLYQSKPVEEFYAIYEDGHEVFKCKSDTWPNFISRDVIVFPASKTWSVVFSHEGTVHYVEPQ